MGTLGGKGLMTKFTPREEWFVNLQRDCSAANQRH